MYNAAATKPHCRIDLINKQSSCSLGMSCSCWNILKSPPFWGFTPRPRTPHKSTETIIHVGCCGFVIGFVYETLLLTQSILFWSIVFNVLGLFVQRYGIKLMSLWSSLIQILERPRKEAKIVGVSCSPSKKKKVYRSCVRVLSQ